MRKGSGRGSVILWVLEIDEIEKKKKTKDVVEKRRKNEDLMKSHTQTDTNTENTNTHTHKHTHKHTCVGAQIG